MRKMAMSEARELTATLNYQYEISCGKIVGVKIGDIKFTWTEGIKPSDKTQVLEAALMKCQPLNIVDMDMVNEDLQQDFFVAAYKAIEEGVTEWRMGHWTSNDLTQRLGSPRLGTAIDSRLLGIPIHIDNQLARGIIVGVGNDGEENTIDASELCKDKSWRKQHKPKVKTNGEQMATLGELFEGYEDAE